MRSIVRRGLIAFGIAIAAVLLWMRRAESPTLSRFVATSPVVIAQSDITEAASIDRMAVIVAQWPVGTVPAGAFTSIDSVAGRVTRVTIFKGEALVPARLAPVGTRPGINALVSPGKRALSFPITGVTGVSGLIQPNSRVDLLLLIDGRTKRRVAKLFMENVRILAAGKFTARTADGRPILAPHQVTVEVTPEEAGRLAVALKQGEIQLMLRGSGTH